MNDQPNTESAASPDQPTQIAPVESFAPPSAPVETPPPQTPPPAAAPNGSGSSSSMPWALIAVAAIVPAVIVGALVFLLAGGSGSDSNVGVVEGFVRLTVGGGSDITSYDGELPEDFPDDFPAFDDGAVTASFAVADEGQTTYIVSYSVDASMSEVYDFYLDALDSDPWQIDLARDADDYTGMQFSRPDSADIEGSLTINHSDLDGKTVIFAIVVDLSQTAVNDRKDYTPPEARQLPPGFPDDVPVYSGENETVVTDTYFQRDAGTNSFLISFVTKDADVDIIDFYRDEFEGRGWNVTDAEAVAGDFALTIEFDDGDSEELNGTIRADVLADDPDYTEVTMIVQVSATRGRGN